MARSEHRYYLLSGTYNLAQFFIAPIYPLFLLSRGLDLFQINAVLATYGITIFLFEVPTGALADVAGRRLSFVLGCAIRTGAYGLYTCARGFQDCLVAEFLDAIGTTFVSGALDAWAVDAMHAETRVRPMDPIFARAAIVARALMIAGGLASGYLAEAGLVLPWLVAAALFALTGIAGGLLMREPPRAVGASGRAMRRTALDGLALVRRSPVLALLCCLSLASAFAALPVFMLWQPRLRDLGAAPPRLTGWVVALMNVASLGGSALVPFLLRRARRETVLGAAALWRSGMVMLLAVSTSLTPALAGIVLQEIAFGLSEPVATAWTNEHVPSAQRATVLSVRSTFIMLGGSAGLLSLGLLARTAGMPLTFATAAIVFVLAAPGYVMLGRIAQRTAVAAPRVAASGAV